MERPTAEPVTKHEFGDGLFPFQALFVSTFVTTNLLRNAGLAPSGGCGLFQWVQSARAATLHEALAQRAILTRHFAAPASLRFGLPGDESGWRRLAAALQEWAA